MSYTNMEAVNVKNALDKVLEMNCADRFHVVGSRGQNTDAESVANKRQVSTYFADGVFKKANSSTTGPFSHDITIKIDLLVAAASPVDLSVLNDPNASTTELSAALAAMPSSSARADELFDDLASVVWNIIMAGGNRKLGLDYNPDRWVQSIHKNDPTPRGALVLLSGSITMTATVLEYPGSETETDGMGLDVVTPLTSDIVDNILDSAAQGVKEGN